MDIVILCSKCNEDDYQSDIEERPADRRRETLKDIMKSVKLEQEHLDLLRRRFGSAGDGRSNFRVRAVL